MKRRYQIIYADPPWMETGGGRIKRGADRHYPLMSTEDIASLPVQDLADSDAHLYLWTTNNFLPAALRVMVRWGFEYKTTITWVKDRFGLGQYFRGQTEHCLFGVRGNLPYKLDEAGKRQQGVTCLHAARGRHSRKPEAMRAMIDKVSDRPGFRKLELFARERFGGWDAWGNEVESDLVAFLCEPRPPTYRASRLPGGTVVALKGSDGAPPIISLM